MNLIDTAVPAAARPQALLESLQARYAVKKFDAAGKIPAAVWAALEEALVLSPSSYGLQPWKFFVVDDPALRQALKAASWGQSQIVDADKLVVFAARKPFGPEDVERFVARIAEVRGASPESLAGYKDMMLGSVARRSPAEVDAWVARQVYIALGTFLTSAAVLGVDACPMEGIEPERYDELLGLKAKGYTALFVATAGYRASDDAYGKAAKVRFPSSQVVERL
jgi:nitroreductase